MRPFQLACFEQLFKFCARLGNQVAFLGVFLGRMPTPFPATAGTSLMMGMLRAETPGYTRGRSVALEAMPTIELDAADLAPTRIVRSEPLSAQAFLDLIKKDPSAIKSVHVESAVIGDAGFGQVVVEYAMPRVRKTPFRPTRKKR